jgi:hypothetical protein
MQLTKVIFALAAASAAVASPVVAERATGPSQDQLDALKQLALFNGLVPENHIFYKDGTLETSRELTGYLLALPKPSGSSAVTARDVDHQEEKRLFGLTLALVLWGLGGRVGGGCSSRCGYRW